MKNIPTPIAEVTLKYHAGLLASRAQALQEWNSKIGEIEAFMRENGIEFQSGLVLAHLTEDATENMPVATAVKAKGKAMILPGVFVTTDEIARSLAADGMQVEQARITRVLSGTGLYKGHKTKGWSLRGEGQTDGNPSASSSATMSEQDEL